MASPRPVRISQRGVADVLKVRYELDVEGDIQLTVEQATILHLRENAHDKVVLWVVTWNTSDYPWKAVARPHLIGPGIDVALHMVLLANSLNELHGQLPDGMHKLARHPEDDPVIVEVWV